MKKYLFICSISLYSIVHTQETLNMDLIGACLKGNIHDVRQLLAQRAQPTCSIGDGQTPLMAACAKDHRSIALELLKRLGKNGVNAKNNKGVSALVLACNGKDPVLVKCLLAKGALANEVDTNGETLLFHACENISILKVLLDHVQSHLSPGDFTTFINSQSSGETALMHACCLEAYESAQLLLEYGADLNIAEDGTNKTALHYAVILNNLDLVKLLLQNKADVDCEDAYEHTALSRAVKNKNKSIARLLIHYGADAATCRIDETDTEILAVAQEASRILIETLPNTNISSDVISAQKYAEQIGSMNLQRALAICGNEACKKPGPKSTCAGCKGVHYCNSDCQKADWKDHKPRCEELRAQANENIES